MTPHTVSLPLNPRDKDVIMKFARQIVPGILALALDGTVAAHNISADGWNPLGSPPGSMPAGGTGTSITLNPASELPEGISLAGITSLSFSPGTGVSNPVNGSYEELTRVNNQNSFYAAADEWVWSGAGSMTGQAVSLTATSLNGTPAMVNAPVLTISVGFDDYDSPTNIGCGSIVGETASVTVNGNTYTAKNPCGLVAGSGDLTFVEGVLQAGTGVGWTLTSTVQAPELDSTSAAGGLTLLLGSVLVIRSRRPAPRTRLFG